MSKKPLEGIRVLDFTNALAGPYCSMMLGNMGAEVIKVEKPGTGDDARGYGPFVNGQSGYFVSVNAMPGTAKRTLASGLVMTFLGEASTNWGYMMAASIVAAVPVTVIFVFLQRYFIQGLTAGAVKG